MSKKLLILAASKYQIPAIKTAKELGYIVITTDNESSNPGHALADISYQIDTKDVDAVRQMAIREKISGVIAPGTDIAVFTAACVAEDLGLAGPPPPAVRVLTQKLAFRDFLQARGMDCPRVIKISRNEHVDESLFDKSRWLLKPNCSSGSKGIFIVNNQKEIKELIASSRSYSLDGEAFLEEFLEGSQHTCEGVLEGGRVVISLITDRDTANPPYTTTVCHRVPSRLSEQHHVQALDRIESVMASLGVNSGPFDCDFVLTQGRVILIELTPRLGGNSLSKLFKEALDFDLVAYAVTTACGDCYPVSEVVNTKSTAIKILGVEREGGLIWNKVGAEFLSQQQWVSNLVFDVPSETQVSAFTNGRNRVGEVLIKGDNRDDLDAKLIEFTKRLDLRAI